MFFIHNPQVNGNNYEFDIYAVVSRTGSYHSRGNIYLNYNPLAFGTSVAINNRVQTSKLILLNETVPNFGPKYNTINIFDNTSSRLSVSWAANYLFAPPGPGAHTEMRTTPTALYHVSLEILNPNATLGVSLHEPLMRNDQFYFVSQGREALYNMTPFPVEWSNLSAEHIGGQQTQINWTTIKEVNTASFEVEKQVNGADFVSISQINAAGYSDAPIQYSIVDTRSEEGQTFYRIKQIDQNGIATFSPVVALKRLEVEKFMVKGYPNPVKDIYQLEIQNPHSDWIEVHIRNLQGQLVKKERFWVEGNQVNRFRIDLEEIKAGCYFLESFESETEHRNKVHKLIKL